MKKIIPVLMLCAACSFAGSYSDNTFTHPNSSGGGGSGTVTSVSVTTANGVSGSVATATTTPAISLTLGAITPITVNGVTLSGSSAPTLAVTGTTTVSGANTGDQTISDATISISDITTNNSSTSKHGFLKKLDNNSAHFMDGTGAWSTPSGGGGGFTTIGDATTGTAAFDGSNGTVLTGTTSGGLRLTTPDESSGPTGAFVINTGNSGDDVSGDISLSTGTAGTLIGSFLLGSGNTRLTNNEFQLKDRSNSDHEYFDVSGGSGMTLTDPINNHVFLSTSGGSGFNLYDPTNSGNQYFAVSGGGGVTLKDSISNRTYLQVSGGSGLSLTETINGNQIFSASSTGSINTYSGSTASMVFSAGSSGVNNYDSGGNQIFSIDSSGINIFDSSNNITFEATTSGLQAGISGNDYLEADDGDLAVSETGSVTFEISSGGVIQAQSLETGGTPPTPSGATKILIADASGVISEVSGGQVVAQADLTGNTTTTAVTGVTSPNDGSSHTYVLGAYVSPTAISAGTITLSAAFFDENNNLRQPTFFSQGLTTAAVSTTGFFAFPPLVIRSKANGVIGILATFSGVSTTYDVGGYIQQIN